MKVCLRCSLPKACSIRRDVVLCTILWLELLSQIANKKYIFLYAAVTLGFNLPKFLLKILCRIKHHKIRQSLLTRLFFSSGYTHTYIYIYKISFWREPCKGRLAATLSKLKIYDLYYAITQLLRADLKGSFIFIDCREKNGSRSRLFTRTYVINVMYTRVQIRFLVGK